MHADLASMELMPNERMCQSLRSLRVVLLNYTGSSRPQAVDHETALLSKSQECCA